mmetsp:Transcript_2524/g.3854  ORF Transcript_2524/g.3854 Transcript_2524/m.3854 type:complete len:364 (-) Transcript_2524:1211-2302(-)
MEARLREEEMMGESVTASTEKLEVMLVLLLTVLKDSSSTFGKGKSFPSMSRITRSVTGERDSHRWMQYSARVMTMEGLMLRWRDLSDFTATVHDVCCSAPSSSEGFNDTATRTSQDSTSGSHRNRAGCHTSTCTDAAMFISNTVPTRVSSISGFTVTHSSTEVLWFKWSTSLSIRTHRESTTVATMIVKRGASGGGGGCWKSMAMSMKGGIILKRGGIRWRARSGEITMRIGETRTWLSITGCSIACQTARETEKGCTTGRPSDLGGMNSEKDSALDKLVTCSSIKISTGEGYALRSISSATTAILVKFKVGSATPLSSYSSGLLLWLSWTTPWTERHFREARREGPEAWVSSLKNSGNMTRI